ncbi:protein patched homolog 1 isoform X1, partial [Tachysurus ichikawai]
MGSQCIAVVGGKRESEKERAQESRAELPSGDWLSNSSHSALYLGGPDGRNQTQIAIIYFRSPSGSRVSRELRYTKEKQGEEAVFTSQMLIQTPKQEGTNILTQESLLLHLEAAVSASKVQVSLYGKSWDLNKICFKSGVPIIENVMIERMIDKLFPCMIVTPLDCFWEGSKLQGGSAYLP